jgi:glycosyltransferase involved in cell wall biosynthesis
MARIRALKPFFDVTAIELASNQRLYQWWRGDTEPTVTTLTSGDWEDQNTLLVAFKLWSLLNRVHPVVILAPGYANYPSICAALWGRLHGAQTILMSESNYEDHPRKSFAESCKRILITLLFTGGIVGGKRSASYLRRLGVPERKIAHCYDVVDNQYFASQVAQCRQNLLESDHSPYFLYVGRLAPEKNVSTLLDAHEQYTNSGGTWPLVIVGNGPLMDDLHEQARIGIRRGSVIFSGHKSVNEFPQIYAFAGCFVLPSICEPWGLVVNEAMASSLPVLVSSHCGCADDLVEDGSNGFIIDPKRVDDIAAKMESVSKMTVEERTKMGVRSREIICNYSPECMALEVKRITANLEQDVAFNRS